MVQQWDGGVLSHRNNGAAMWLLARCKQWAEESPRDSEIGSTPPPSVTTIQILKKCNAIKAGSRESEEWWKATEVIENQSSEE